MMGEHMHSPSVMPEGLNMAQVGGLQIEDHNEWNLK